jgi:hypothetical protein
MHDIPLPPRDRRYFFYMIAYNFIAWGVVLVVAHFAIGWP